MTIELEKLKQPFPPSDIEWRIGQAGKKKNGEIWAKVLAYITNRAIMDRLDEVCGPTNWRNEYSQITTVGPKGERIDGFLCGISILIDGVWVTKWDGAEMTDIETVKGGLSSSMKRAGVQWGIGRYLYDLGESWAEINEGGSHYANCKVRVGDKEEWVNFRWDAPKLAPQFLPPASSSPPRAAATKAPPASNGNGAKPQQAEDDKAYKVLADALHSGGIDGLPGQTWRLKAVNAITRESKPIKPSVVLKVLAGEYIPMLDTDEQCHALSAWIAGDLFNAIGSNYQGDLDALCDQLAARQKKMAAVA